jgi:hypothetical protein
MPNFMAGSSLAEGARRGERFRLDFRFSGGRFSGLFGSRLQTGHMPIQIPLDPSQYLALLALVLAYLATYR